MKNMLLVISLVLAVAAPAFAWQDPPEDFDKLNANAEEKFHVKPWGQPGGFKVIYGKAKPYPGKPVEAVEKFLKEYHRMFKLSNDIEEIKFKSMTGESGKLSKGRNRVIHLEYQQYYEDVPVYYVTIKN